MVAKRVSIVTCKLVRECPSIQYANRKINSPDDVLELINPFLLGEKDREGFLAIYLDRKNQPAAIQTISIGTVSSSLVHPREVFKGAILANSSSIILVHDHPSGDPSPSREDIEISKRLKEAGEILGIEMLDSLIIGSGDRFCSLKSSGQL